MDKSDVKILMKDINIIWDNLTDIEDYLQSMYNPLNKVECNIFNNVIKMLSRTKHVTMITQRDISSILVRDNIEDAINDKHNNL